MTVAANRQSNEFNEIKRDMCDDVDFVVTTTPLSCNETPQWYLVPTKLKKIERLKNVFGKKEVF